MLLQPTAGVRKLRLHIENRSTSKARARRVVVFSKYWIINRTNLLLFFATRGQAKEPTVCNPQQVRGRGGQGVTGKSFGERSWGGDSVGRRIRRGVPPSILVSRLASRV